MGLLDMQQGQQQPTGGLLGAAMQPQGQMPMQAPQGGGAPPEMMQAVQHIKQCNPQTQMRMIQQITQQIQSSGKPPELIQQVMQQFMQALKS